MLTRSVSEPTCPFEEARALDLIVKVWFSSLAMVTDSMVLMGTLLATSPDGAFIRITSTCSTPLSVVSSSTLMCLVS